VRLQDNPYAGYIRLASLNFLVGPAGTKITVGIQHVIGVKQIISMDMRTIGPFLRSLVGSAEIPTLSIVTVSKYVDACQPHQERIRQDCIG
jgi:hypothetical protein